MNSEEKAKLEKIALLVDRHSALDESRQAFIDGVIDQIPAEPALDGPHPAGTPNLFIIGTVKGGTTSLARFVADASNGEVRRGYTKEIRYFTQYWGKEDLDWFRGRFVREDGCHLRCRYLLDGTPHYLRSVTTNDPHGGVPQRIKLTMPNGKALRFIAVLRDPVDRLYSYFHMDQQMGGSDHADFEAWLIDSLNRSLEILGTDMRDSEGDDWVFTGQYAEQLRVWFACWPRDQLLILHCKDLFRGTETRERVRSFLDLSSLSGSDFPKIQLGDAGSYAPMKPETRGLLNRLFAVPNERLFNLLGQDYGWPI